MNKETKMLTDKEKELLRKEVELTAKEIELSRSMQWTDPQITLPTKYKIYLVIFEKDSKHILTLAMCRPFREWNDTTEEYDDSEDPNDLYFESLYNPTKIRGLIL